MNKPLLLDCTLRDGGYVNDWRFGKDNIANIKRALEQSGVDILELGFLRNEARNEERTAFSTVEDVNHLLGRKKNGVIYSAMIEAFNPYPLEKLAPFRTDGIDLIRICIWKRCMEEHLTYCKGVAEKGYQISIQPSRVEQYNELEFTEMLKRSNELHPCAVYVVDTWGTQSSSQICRYLELADRWLDPGIKVGYHGHNNKLQALSCAQAALQMPLSHELCLDASIMGMGRGAGNLNTEVIMDWLNENYGRHYAIDMILEAFHTCLADIYREHPWGYSLYYYLSAIYGCNPNFATYFSDKDYGTGLFQKFLSTLTEQEKIVFTPQFTEERLRML